MQERWINQAAQGPAEPLFSEEASLLFCLNPFHPYAKQLNVDPDNVAILDWTWAVPVPAHQILAAFSLSETATQQRNNTINLTSSY
jgi:hypothetical protein